MFITTFKNNINALIFNFECDYSVSKIDPVGMLSQK